MTAAIVDSSAFKESVQFRFVMKTGLARKANFAKVVCVKFAPVTGIVEKARSVRAENAWTLALTRIPAQAENFAKKVAARTALTMRPVGLIRSAKGELVSPDAPMTKAVTVGKYVRESAVLTPFAGRKALVREDRFVSMVAAKPAKTMRLVKKETSAKRVAASKAAGTIKDVPVILPSATPKTIVVLHVLPEKTAKRERFVGPRCAWVVWLTKSAARANFASMIRVLRQIVGVRKIAKTAKSVRKTNALDAPMTKSVV